jgi:hypothetical protein
MIRKPTELKTVGDVIDAFGGIREMCAIFGGVPSKFANWKLRGFFPDYMHHKLYKAARKRGLNIADELLGGDDEELRRELPLVAAE